MALDVTRAKAEIDTLALTHANAIREKDGRIAGLQAGIAALTEENGQLRAQLEKLRPPPPARTAWGSSIEQRGQSFGQALTRVEGTLGRLDTVRYFTAGTTGPAWSANLTALEGRGIVYSAKSPPAQVLAGGADDRWRAWFGFAVGYLERWPDAVVDWTNWHEPEDDVERGAFTAAEWRAALARLVALQRREYGHPRLRSDQILMAYTLGTPKRKPADYVVPEVDVHGWDCYIGLGPKTPEQAVEPLEAFSRVQGKPWAVAECGVSALIPDRASVLTGYARRLAGATPPPAYVTYFSSDPGGPSEHGWPIDANPVLAAAWLAGRG